jgi:hypothetical protein
VSLAEIITGGRTIHNLDKLYRFSIWPSL